MMEGNALWEVEADGIASVRGGTMEAGEYTEDMEATFQKVVNSVWDKQLETTINKAINQTVINASKPAPAHTKRTETA